MGAQRTTFEKLQRDRAKKAKAAAKREKRLERKNPSEEVETDEDLTPLSETEEDTPLSAGELLQRIEALHNKFEAKKISFEDFEEEKAELMRRLPID